jgi:2-dehydro-3-deoxyphosphogluconate aldolase / (4S)-4-hydroxy-2-oxoglutarate aldolase
MSSDKARRRLEAMFAIAPVVPVITIDKADDAVPLARALIAGGLRVVEITLRTAAGLKAAEAILREVPDAIVGLGTVVTPDDMKSAARIGVAFALSPGMTPDLLQAAAEFDMPFVPGIQTASELLACMVRGFELVKFFPAVPAGGLAALNALSGPFPTVRYCPTGGINETNVAEWLSHPRVIAVGGSWIAPAADIRAGAWSIIEARARSAVALRRKG